MNKINNIINEQICYDILEELKDEKLMPIYIESDSVKNNIKKYEKICNKYTDIETTNKILNDPDFLQIIIPAGTKGVIRGNKFNDIIKNNIIKLDLNKDKYDICFEKNISIISERPDWYILEKSTNKIIIGMNQLSLTGGGAQTNRGDKYIFNNKINNENCKLLCVICNYEIFKSIKSKEFKIYEHGFNNNTLCYIKNLEKIIKLFFK